MKPRVFVARRIPQAGLDRIEPVCDVDLWEDRMPPPYDVLTERVKGVDGILSMLTDKIDDALMEAAGPQLKVISQMAVGYDNVQVAAAHARGIKVGNTPGVLTDATADAAFALLMAAARRLAEGTAYIRAGEWKTWEPTAMLGADVSGATLGIVGLGRIGQAVAKRARGFDMRILARSPSTTPHEAQAFGATLVDLQTLLSESDFVTLHVPLNTSTTHLINRDTLAMMKPTAILINTARGRVVDQKALYEALTNGVIGGAALDVTDPEPMDANDPLMSLPNALIVPHIGSATIKTRDKMATIAADNLIAGVLDKPLRHEVVRK
jgi:lactate dehydrogenase-like 2-hydroxyacid dehydrogenase